jgi:hypothetical protein
MTTKADVSSANWAALVDAGPAIARAVAASAGSSGQTEQELEAFIEFLSESGAATDRGTVVGELLADVGGRLATGTPAPDGDAYMNGLELARRAGAIAAVELEPDEARAVRAWYLAAATRVARAAREGGIAGLGGSDISAWERETLQTIADALGVSEE